MLERLADELETEREGQAYSLIAQEVIAGLPKVGGAGLPGGLRILDGTASPELLRAFIPRLAVSDEIRVERNAFVVQVTDRTFYRGSLLKSAEAGEEASHTPHWWKEVCGFIERTAQGSRTLVVTNKRVRCQLTGEDATTALPSVQDLGMLMLPTSAT